MTVTVAPLDSLSAAVQTLQQVFEAQKPGHALSEAEVAKTARAKGFPDQDLAVAVWRHLEAEAAAVNRNVVERKLTDDKISKALFFVLLDPETGKAKRSKGFNELSTSFRTVLRQLAQRLGLAMSELGEIAEETGMGVAPFLTDLAEEFAAWIERARRGNGEADA